MALRGQGRAADRSLLALIAAMTVVVVSSNILVQYPINAWLTYGALTYPVAFLVTDITNRRFGPAGARRVALVGFVLAVLLSIILATPRIALASGTAFLLAQWLDIAVFDRLRNGLWWQAPLVSSALASILDTFVFFALAFAGTGVPWMTLGMGDLLVKWGMAMVLLLPYKTFGSRT